AAPRLSADVEVDAVERIAAMGIIVVSSAGNKADPNTIGSPGTALSMVTVGASFSDRTFFPGSVSLDGGSPIGATTGDEDTSTDPISGPLLDISTLDQAGTACLPFPLNSLSGKIVFILRGDC